MINYPSLRIVAAAALLGACSESPPAAPDGTPSEEEARAVTTDAPAPGTGAVSAPPEDEGQYTSIDRSKCRLIEQNVEEGGYYRHRCDGLWGYKLETTESDLRQDIIVIARDGRRSGLQLSGLVARGAFNELGRTAEWRGGPNEPRALIVRLNVADPTEPMQPDTSKLVVARLEAPACVVAVVPPGPDQNARARQIADGPLPDCMKL